LSGDVAHLRDGFGERQTGDPQTRWAAHQIAVEAGILDADEIREIEGFNPRAKAVIG